MDPASASELRDFLARSNSRMDHQDEQRAVSNRAIQALVTQVSELTTQLQRLQSEPEQRPTASNPPAPTIPDQAGRVIEPRLPPPAFYSGEPQQCRSFLAKCSLYISLQPSSFPTEESKIAFVITLLSGRAALWGTTVWEQKLPCCASFQLFSEEIRKVFDRAASGREAARLLAELWQEIGASLISPLNSALWRQSAGGTQKRSGICSFMDSLITSRTRSTHWNYPRHWMG